MARRRRRSRGRNRQREDRRQKSLAFWGDVDALPDRSADVRIADEPATAVKSLGNPPLPGRDVVAAHYLEAVLNRTAGVAAALSAASGMIDPASLVDGSNDED